ncbi:hypothetical protein H2200_009938 [Cladophialophora chaetospira]|uniref:Uncharacterized protein n=1 Tax=Cladophialophora chaetospira TaxID=386627 RepID=A0AA38X1W2_9EURO|nr:hypothetical protein H2200_009938 [Cladophialophora chaetospira]
MESDSLRPKRLISFSQRVAAFPASRNDLDHPSNEDLTVEETYNAPTNFRNEIPSEDIDIRRSLIRWQHHTQSSDSSLRSELRQNENLLQTILLPAAIICIPIALLAGVLFGLCYLYKINPVDSLFDLSDDALDSSRGFILVNFPATRLVFVASFLSTLAPLLGSFIMSLYCLPVSRDLLDASQNGAYLHLPTPFQMSLLIGVLVASAQQLRSYIWYLLHRRRSGIPPVLHRAALVMLLSFFLAGGVFIADTVLHYTTSTIEFDQISIPSQPEQQLGRGLSEYCLKFNRELGYPCSVTYDGRQINPNADADATEASRLFHNMSQVSEVQVAAVDKLPADVAYLVPKQQTFNPNTDYKASTIGISTECRFINPEECHMMLWKDYYSNFTCTDMFHGTLGMPPNVSANVNDARPTDPYRSFLEYKPAGNLMYSFFSDPSMENVYNTAALQDDGNRNATLQPYTDAQLVNPFYMGLAARVDPSSGNFVTGSQMLKDDNNSTFLVNTSDNNFVDFLLSCAVTSYDVSYTWLNGGLESVEAVPTSNGSVLEIFHGSLLYFTVTGDDPDMQNFLTQASLAGTTTESFLREYGSLYSTKALSVIGGYTTGRMAIAEQQREHMLLSKVPIAPLAILVAWSLSYTLLGFILAFKAFWASRDNVRDIAAKLSLVGLSQAAFGDKHSEPSSGGNSLKEKTVDNQSETRRVLVDGSAAQGFEFGVMV